MRSLPKEMIQILAPFAPLFSERVWQYAQVLLAGVTLTPVNAPSVSLCGRWAWTNKSGSITNS